MSTGLELAGVPGCLSRQRFVRFFFADVEGARLSGAGQDPSARPVQQVQVRSAVRGSESGCVPERDLLFLDSVAAHRVTEEQGVAQLLQEQRPDDVIREYLLEAERLVTSSQRFAVLAHIDYPARYWDQFVRTGPFDPGRYEDEFRHVLGALASSNRALEVNTQLQPFPLIISWWRQAGGQAITFGSDAHTPSALAAGFADAAKLAEAESFAPGRDAHDVWHRVVL